jgi:hypothetical protein
MKRYLFCSLASLCLMTGLVIGCSGQLSPTTPPVEPTAVQSQSREDTTSPTSTASQVKPTPTAPPIQVNETDESQTTATSPIEPTSQPKSDEKSEPEGTPSHGGPVRDYVSLIDNLRAAGVTVEPVGEISQPFFSVKGQIIKVNGEDVQVFEYATEAEAEAEAATVSSDGGSIGTSMVSWIASPHFYKTGKLITLYVGDNQSAIAALEIALGPQFAGR